MAKTPKCFDGGRAAVGDGLRNTAIVNYGILTLVN